MLCQLIEIVNFDDLVECCLVDGKILTYYDCGFNYMYWCEWRKEYEIEVIHLRSCVSCVCLCTLSITCDHLASLMIQVT